MFVEVASSPKSSGVGLSGTPFAGLELVDVHASACALRFLPLRPCFLKLVWYDDGLVGPFPAAAGAAGAAGGAGPGAGAVADEVGAA